MAWARFDRGLVRKLVAAKGAAAIAVVAGAACLGAFAPTAYADPPAQAAALRGNAEILVMHAVQAPGPGSIDPRIGSMPQLTKPPFSAYNTYKLLDKKLLPLAKGKPADLGLVNGRTLQVTLLDQGSDRRYRVSTAINDPGKAAFLKLLEVTAAPGEPFFVAGQSYEGGTLIIAIAVKP